MMVHMSYDGFTKPEGRDPDPPSPCYSPCRQVRPRTQQQRLHPGLNPFGHGSTAEAHSHPPQPLGASLTSLYPAIAAMDASSSSSFAPDSVAGLWAASAGAAVMGGGGSGSDLGYHPLNEQRIPSGLGGPSIWSDAASATAFRGGVPPIPASEASPSAGQQSGSLQQQQQHQGRHPASSPSPPPGLPADAARYPSLHLPDALFSPEDEWFIRQQQAAAAAAVASSSVSPSLTGAEATPSGGSWDATAGGPGSIQHTGQISTQQQWQGHQLPLSASSTPTLTQVQMLQLQALAMASAAGAGAGGSSSSYPAGVDEEQREQLALLALLQQWQGAITDRLLHSGLPAPPMQPPQEQQQQMQMQWQQQWQPQPQWQQLPPGVSPSDWLPSSSGADDDAAVSSHLPPQIHQKGGAPGGRSPKPLKMGKAGGGSRRSRQPGSPGQGGLPPWAMDCGGVTSPTAVTQCVAMPQQQRQHPMLAWTHGVGGSGSNGVSFSDTAAAGAGAMPPAGPAGVSAGGQTLVVVPTPGGHGQYLQYALHDAATGQLMLLPPGSLMLQQLQQQQQMMMMQGHPAGGAHMHPHHHHQQQGGKSHGGPRGGGGSVMVAAMAVRPAPYETQLTAAVVQVKHAGGGGGGGHVVPVAGGGATEGTSGSGTKRQGSKASAAAMPPSAQQ